MASWRLGIGRKPSTGSRVSGDTAKPVADSKISRPKAFNTSERLW